MDKQTIKASLDFIIFENQETHYVVGSFSETETYHTFTGAGHLGRKNIEFGADGTVTLKGVKSKNDAFQIDENGNVTIVGKVSTSAAGARIEIDPATKSIRMYNENNDRVFWAYLSQRTTGGGTR